MGSIIDYSFQINNLKNSAVPQQNKKQKDRASGDDRGSDSSDEGNGKSGITNGTSGYQMRSRVEVRESEFSATQYFFPSVYLAHKMPHLPESHFILSYTDPYPKMTFHKTKYEVDLINDNFGHLKQQKQSQYLTICRTIFASKYVKLILGISMTRILLLVGSLP